MATASSAMSVQILHRSCIHRWRMSGFIKGLAHAPPAVTDHRDQHDGWMAGPAVRIVSGLAVSHAWLDETPDLVNHVLGMTADTRPEVYPSFFLITHVDSARPSQHVPMFVWQARERPVRRCILGSDVTRCDGAPDPSERQDHVPRVPVEIAKQLVDAADDRRDVVLARDWVEHFIRWRPQQWPVREEHHRDQGGEITARCRRPRLDVATLELWVQPFAILKVELGWIVPRPNFGLDHNRQARSATAPPANRSRRSESNHRRERRFSSRVVGRFDTTKRSRSLRGRSPPRTSEPWRYAPTRSGPSTSRTRANVCSSCSSTVG